MKLTAAQYVILLSGLATAVLHLSLFRALGPMDPIFLNGLGYIALLGAYFLPIPLFQDNHRIVWWALAGYTLLTIVLWVILGEKNFNAGGTAPIGYYAKAAEVILLIALWLDRR